MHVCFVGKAPQVIYSVGGMSVGATASTEIPQEAAYQPGDFLCRVAPRESIWSLCFSDMWQKQVAIWNWVLDGVRKCVTTSRTHRRTSLYCPELAGPQAQPHPPHTPEPPTPGSPTVGHLPRKLLLAPLPPLPLRHKLRRS